MMLELSIRINQGIAETRVGRDAAIYEKYISYGRIFTRFILLLVFFNMVISSVLLMVHKDTEYVGYRINIYHD